MTSTYYGAEAVEEAVAATLRLSIDGQLDTIYTAANDATPKVYPKQIYAGRRDIAPEYPAIMVASVDGTQALDASPGWGEMNHRLDVSWLAQSDDYRTLDKQVKRGVWAIWNLLKTHQGLDNSLMGLAGVQLMRYGLSQVIKTKPGTLLQVGAWEVIVRQEVSTF